MDNKELLFKLNSIQKHNEILRLKKKLEDTNANNEEFQKNYMDAVTNYREKVKDSVSDLNQKIEILEKENQYYKSVISKIPSFIVRIFNGKGYKQIMEDKSEPRL